MRGFGHRAFHVEMKHGFRLVAFLGDTPSLGVSLSCGAVAGETNEDEIDVDVSFVDRPVPLEILQERVLVRLKFMDLKVP